MRISDIITDKSIKIVNEKEFKTLGILASKVDESICTFLDSEKYINDIKENVSMLITTLDIYNRIKNEKNSYGFVIVPNPRIFFFELHNSLCNNNKYIREMFDTQIGDNCNISDLTYISNKNVIIGNNVTIEEFVSIKENVIIGDNCKIGAGTVIGGTGFEFKHNNEEIISVIHVGGVKIDNNVEIQYNTTIDKAIYPWDNTVIGEYTKIDNLNHIAHACKIGKRVMIPAGSTIAGRVEIGDDSWIGINSTIRNGMKIGECARTNMGAVVTKNVEDNESVTGNFAIEHSLFIKKLKKWSENE